MTQPNFVRRLDAALVRRGVAVKQAELMAWVEATWPRVQRDPDAARWADAFLEERAARMKERLTTDQEQAATTGAEAKKPDHSSRLILVVVAVLTLVVLWKTDANILSRILRALGL